MSCQRKLASRNILHLYAAGFFIYLCIASCEAAPIGDIAKDLFEPARYLARFVHWIFMVTGIGLIISALIKYLDYRRHHHVRLSLIFFLLLTGLALIGIGFLPIPELSY